MYELTVLTKRNILIFIRDKVAVFFSFFSVIILLGLYILFLKNAYINDWLKTIYQPKEIDFFANSLLLSGILVINTVTLSLGNLGNIITDFEKKIINSFLVTPVKRFKIIFSHYLSSLIITYVFSLIMWLLAVLIVGFTTSIWYSLPVIIIISGLLLVFTFISTGLMIFITTFITSVNAFGAISGVLGTVIGFISGIYMPLSILPKAVQNISSLIPFTHMTALMKNYLLEPSFNLITLENKEEIILTIKETYNIGNIPIFNIEINMVWILLVSCFISFLFLGVATQRLSKKIGKK